MDTPPTAAESQAEVTPGTVDHLASNALALVRAHWEIIPLVAFGLAANLYYLRQAASTGLPFDDSYISLQFARNLAEHGFLTFDGETASAGATSLLHVVLLALPLTLGSDPVEASLAAGVLVHLSLVVAVYWLAWSIFRDRWIAGLAAFSMSLIGYAGLDALNGMETTLFMLTTTCAAAALFSARSDRGYLLAGAFGAACVLTRPEGVLFVGAMAAYYVLRSLPRERAELPELARGLALIALPAALSLFALALFYYATTDTFTPGTATAKVLFFREFEADADVRADAVYSSIGRFLAPLLPWIVLSAFSLQRRESLLFAVFGVAFVTMYFFLFPNGLTHYWYRYQHVFLPAIAAFGSAGAVIAIRGRSLRSWDLAVVCAIGALLVAGVFFQFVNFRDTYAQEVNLNETRGVAMAEFLRETVPQGQTIATHDIGNIGYSSEREVIDLVGLINPDVIDYHEDRRVRQYVDKVQPNYIVVFPGWERDFLHIGLVQDPFLFEEIARFAGGGTVYVVYETHYDDR